MVQIVNPLTIVNVGGGGTDIGIPREISQSGVYQVPSNLTTYTLPAGVTDLGGYALHYAFYGCTSLTSANLSSLTAINGRWGLGYAFSGCTNLANVDLSGLTAINAANGIAYAFTDCTSLSSVNFSSLSTIIPPTSNAVFGYTFMRCSNLSISFPAITSSSFGSYTSQFNSMLYNATNITLHFPTSLPQTTISSLNGYPNFGGTNVTILYDL